jgi:putative flippase GtrA
MLETIKKIVRLCRAEMAYLIVGGLTTIVNYAVYFFCMEFFRLSYLSANTAAWVIAVVFSYFANRRWVFLSKDASVPAEMCKFVLSRIFSLLLENALLLLGVDIIGINEYIAKATVAVIVVVCNYITGKWIVFKPSGTNNRKIQ